MSSLEEIIAERESLQEETHILANETLPQLNQDKSGVLEVTIREVRNVATGSPEEEGGDEDTHTHTQSEEDNEDNDDQVLLNGHTSSSTHTHKHQPLRFLVSVSPTTVMDQEGEDQIEVEELGGMARFPLTSLEAKVVVHFGPRLEHYVRVPLHNKYKESELAQVSDWHSSASGEETETPGIQDLTGVPQVQLFFRYLRKNKEDVSRVMAQLDKLQKDLGALRERERALLHGEEEEEEEGEEGEEGDDDVGGRRGAQAHTQTHTHTHRGGGSSAGGGGKSSSRRSLIRNVDDDDDDDEEGEDEDPTFQNRVLSLWRWFSRPFILIIHIGQGVGGFVWHRRALFMFVGGTLFFHFRGDDLAV